MVDATALQPSSLQQLYEREHQQQQAAEPLPMRLHKQRSRAASAAPGREHEQHQEPAQQPDHQDLRASAAFCTPGAAGPGQQAALRASLQGLDPSQQPQQQGSMGCSKGAGVFQTGGGTPMVFGAKLSASMGQQPLAAGEAQAAPQVSGYQQQQPVAQQAQGRAGGWQPAPALHRAGPLFSEAPAYDGAMFLEQQLHAPLFQQPPAPPPPAPQQHPQQERMQQLRQSTHAPIYQATGPLGAPQAQPQAWQAPQQPSSQQPQLAAGAFLLPAAPPPAHPFPAYATPPPAPAAPEAAPAWQPAPAPAPATPRPAPPASPVQAHSSSQVTITFSQPGGSQVQLQLPAPPASPPAAPAASLEGLQGAWPAAGPRASIVGGMGSSEQQSLDSTAASIAMGNMMAMLAAQQQSGEGRGSRGSPLRWAWPAAASSACDSSWAAARACPLLLRPPPHPRTPTHTPHPSPATPRPQASAARCRALARCTAATWPSWTATRPTPAAPTSAPPACPPTLACH
jgi:hypothetical protein